MLVTPLEERLGRRRRGEVINCVLERWTPSDIATLGFSLE